MRKNSTSSKRAGLAAALLFAATTACAKGDPDPRAVRASLALWPERPTAARDAALPVVAHPGVVEMPASAPMGEVETRRAMPARRPLTIAVGRNCGDAMGKDLQEAFGRAHPEFEGAFQASADRDAVEMLLSAKVDFALLGGQLSIRDQQAGLQQARLGLELFGLLVAADFPARSLTRAQVRQVLSGEVTEWARIGVDAGQVMVVAPADRDLSERASRCLMPGDDFAQAAARTIDGRQARDLIRRQRGGVAVVRVPAGAVEEGLRLLQIDWTPASAETFAYGTYPYGLPVQLVTAGRPLGAAMQFLQFAQSEEGRELLGRALLVP